jgi:hypothetical protein
MKEIPKYLVGQNSPDDTVFIVRLANPLIIAEVDDELEGYFEPRRWRYPLNVDSL